MSGSVNKVILIGNVGKDPEVREFSNGGKIVTFSLATTETWKKDGERKEKTQWHNISVTNTNLCRIAEQYVRKGSKLYVEGTLENRSWEDANGQKKYATDVVLGFNSTMTMLSKSEGGTAAPASSYQAPEGSGGGRPSSDIDDTIPFAPEWRI